MARNKIDLIRREGDTLTVPETMSLSSARDLLLEVEQAEEQRIRRTLALPPHLPADVAVAFQRSILEVCGIAMGQGRETFFGSQPPEVRVERISDTETVEFFLGDLRCPFDPKNGELSVGATHDARGQWVGYISGTFRQKFLPVWERIAKQTRERLKTGSIYKGHSLRVSFTDGDHEDRAFPAIAPWTVAGALDSDILLFDDDVQAAVEDHLLTPLQHPDAIAKAGIPVKRGVLLAGLYGTGKTALARLMAKVALLSGWTVLYLDTVRDLPHGIRFAAAGLGRTLIIAEDLDRIGQDRDENMDTLLNTLDGVDTKDLPVMTVLTTNYPERLYPGIIRPGRIDAVIEIPPPGPAVALRIARMYLGEQYNDADSSEAEEEKLAAALAGLIPATIREICERSKLSTVTRTGKAPQEGSITAGDVHRAAGSMRNQLSMIAKAIVAREAPAVPALDTALRSLVADSASKAIENRWPE
jgi:transitional endoplasmic reticulum ATPase